ncbi:SurA N-terminal domain-containing protein [Oxalobacter vibrioformis]|uniref:Periplasmic chaperone PpiD n=1 Tax=Oxalobacter vibrioformis TaxID=933080 RepID=A0A9E9M008_9BURK|nr:SurA N-terminal domain-containing protein [Oxalobacter vibrioformis]WAW10674.1 SurA N-terminal domain-containing protein [Oxalobacter vibrioformis]
MLELIRRNKLMTQIILLVFIVPSFIFFGVQGYDLIGDGNAPAKVDGKTISEQEWENAQREQADMLRQRAGQQFDPKWIESPNFKWMVLDRLIDNRVISTEIASEKLAIPDVIVLQKIMEIPGLTTEDGKLDKERYEAGLKAQGMTDQMHFAMMRQDLLQQQIAAPLQYGFYVPQLATEHIWDIFEQEREVQVKVFKASDYRAQVKVTPEELETYYTNNGPQFAIPEHVSIELVVLDMQSIEDTIKISEADIKSYYEQNSRRFAVPEERRVSHILIEVPKSASESDHKAARDKAESLLAQLKENPAGFAELAKANSKDPGSAAGGGDLGFFSRGKMVRPFEEAAFVLRKGELSEVVQTDFGYHIIMLTDIKPAVEKPLSAVRPQVVEEIQKQLAAKKYAEAAEIFSNTVYEQPDSLKPVADKLKLKILKVDNLTREPNPAYAKHPVLSNPKFLQAVFSDEVTKNKHNTEAIEIGPQFMVAARASQYYPAAVKPFNEVKGGIEKVMLAQKTVQLAKEAGEAELAKLKEGSVPRGFSPSVTVSRQMINMTGRLDLMPIMKADISKLPAYVPGVDYPEGYVLYRINKVTTPVRHNPQIREAMRTQLMRSTAQQEMFAYMSYLRTKAKVERLRKPEEQKTETPKQP